MRFSRSNPGQKSFAKFCQAITLHEPMPDRCYLNVSIITILCRYYCPLVPRERWIPRKELSCVPSIATETSLAAIGVILTRHTLIPATRTACSLHTAKPLLSAAG
jgi:hypothetical protein